MGEAWLARKGAAPPVVLKRVLPGLAARKELLDRFLHEARIVARLSDPCIARVLELGEVHGQWFIAMEYVEGGDLQSRLEKGPPLSLDEVRRVGGDGASALLAAHGARDAQGRATPVIHRDVSPHNLLLGKDGRVRLIDFGVASLTGEGESGGKLMYAAPEQLLEDVADARSDQYSLGVVLWECLAGRPAFDAEEDVEVIRLVTEVGVPELPATVPPELRAVVTRMTAMKPSERFDDLRDVALALAPRQRASAPASVLPLTPTRAPARGEGTSGGFRDGMTVDEAEAAIGLDALQDLLEAGEIRAEDRDGERYFYKAR